MHYTTCVHWPCRPCYTKFYHANTCRDAITMHAEQAALTQNSILASTVCVPNLLIVLQVNFHFRKTVVTTVITADTQCENVITTHNHDCDHNYIRYDMLWCAVQLSHCLVGGSRTVWWGKLPPASPDPMATIRCHMGTRPCPLLPA